MKSLKPYLLIAVLSLSTLFVPSAFPNAVAPVKGIDVIVRKNPGTAARMIAEPNPDGSFSVKLREPGNYTISYASGPNKGKVIQTLTATHPGAARLSASIKAGDTQ